MPNTLSLSEQLMYITVRIECELNNKMMSTGTGFFFQFFENKETGEVIPLIITNKHVVKGSIKGRMIFCKRKDDGEPDDINHITLELDSFESLWIMHPDPTVDLCAMPIAPWLMQADRLGQHIFYITMNPDNLANEKTLSELSSLEDIIMIGYPNGIWDAVNNKPIFRKGITATDVRLDYNGKKEFVIDAACFPGSSGSPVMIINPGIYSDKNGNSYARPRLVFLGILYAGPQATAEGIIQTVVVPTVDIKNIALSRIPNNLGYVIKAEKVLEFESLLKKNE